MKKAFLSTVFFAALLGVPAMTMAPALAQTAATAQASTDMTQASTEGEYRSKLMMLGTMSLMASEVAEDKASNAMVKEFATFEVAEQTAIASVLTDMNTPKAAMDAKGQAVLDQLKAASGAEFDRAYLQASLDTHRQLEALNENYLRSPASSPAEQHAHHLATVALPTIKQHIAQSTELMQGVK